MFKFSVRDFTIIYTIVDSYAFNWNKLCSLHNMEKHIEFQLEALNVLCNAKTCLTKNIEKRTGTFPIPPPAYYNYYGHRMVRSFL